MFNFTVGDPTKLVTDAIENALKWDVSYIREPLMEICRLYADDEKDYNSILVALLSSTFSDLFALLDCIFADYETDEIDDPCKTDEIDEPCEECTQCDVGGD